MVTQIDKWMLLYCTRRQDLEAARLGLKFETS